ncbi:MAG: acyl carrier protein [Deltaproteobacteria bacterium]|nr:acyl carrier protein [Deltaproteobacteria bacterium]
MDFTRELKELIVRTLKLEGVTPDQIEDGAPLFGGGLGLDSIDVLELTVAVEKRYGVSIPDEATGKQAFASVEALARFIVERRPAP